MKKDWVKYLCDPIDKTDITLFKVVKSSGSYILRGKLKSESGNIYDIKNGVPILVNKKTQSLGSVESFAYEWNTFDFDYGKKGWINDIIKPVVNNTKYFNNKVVVDCGAGSGRQSLWMAEAGSKFVFSIELSNSATSIVRKVTNIHKNKIFVIQADIANLPLKKDSVNIDIIYCVNVIQHTKNPIKSTQKMSSLVRANSEFIFNIYMLRNNFIKIKIIQFLKNILSVLSTLNIKKISYLISAILYPFMSKRHSFKEFWLDVYDLLGSHSYQEFYSEKYLARLLNKSNLEIIKKSYYSMLLKKIN